MQYPHGDKTHLYVTKAYLGSYKKNDQVVHFLVEIPFMVNNKLKTRILIKAMCCSRNWNEAPAWSIESSMIEFIWIPNHYWFNKVVKVIGKN